MWHDSDEDTAPAIVISSLGGLAYANKETLSSRDLDRSRMLRRVLKRQLGHLSRPRTNGDACMDPMLEHHDANNPCESNIIYHHHALPGVGATATNNPVYSLKRRPTSSVQQLQHLDNDRSSHASAEAVASNPRHDLSAASGSRHGRGWRPQGMLAGEWRDRFGRSRRACSIPSTLTCHSHQNVGVSAVPQHQWGALVGHTKSLSGSDRRAPAAGAAPSCAGTEVSFEGLIEELRERVPPAFPLMELVTPQHHEMACGDDNDHIIRTSNSTAAMMDGGDPVKGKFGKGHRIEARAEFPPGCLKLSRAVRIAGKKEGSSSGGQSRKLGENGNSQSGALSATPQNDVGTLLSSAGHGVSMFADGNMAPGSSIINNRVASITVALNEAASSTSSPSAAMVAAAKAQERALPLLQVCAVQVIPSGQPRIGRGTMGVGVR